MHAFHCIPIIACTIDVVVNIPLNLVMNLCRKGSNSGKWWFTSRESCAIIGTCWRGFRQARSNLIETFFSAQRWQSVGVKGNQVQILSDPVTVSGEIRRMNPLCHRHEKERQASTIRKSGNLLKDAAHSFRRKRPARFHLTQFQFILKRPLFGRKAGAFVMDCRRAALRGPPTRPSLRLA